MRRCRGPTASSCSTRSGTAARSAWASSCWSASASPWSVFRDYLVAAIEQHGQPEGETDAEAYYVAFLDALESLAAAHR